MEFEYIGTLIVLIVLFTVAIQYLMSIQLEIPSFKYPSLAKCHYGAVDKEQFLESIEANCSGNYTLKEAVSMYDLYPYLGNLTVDPFCNDNSVSSAILQGEVEYNATKNSVCEK